MDDFFQRKRKTSKCEGLRKIRDLDEFTAQMTKKNEGIMERHMSKNGNYILGMLISENGVNSRLLTIKPNIASNQIFPSSKV